MATLEELQRIETIVADMKRHPGQWTMVARQVPTARGRPYRRRGCQVVYRQQATPGIADVLARWPVAKATDSSALPPRLQA